MAAGQPAIVRQTPCFVNQSGRFRRRSSARSRPELGLESAESPWGVSQRKNSSKPERLRPMLARIANRIAVLRPDASMPVAASMGSNTR